MKKELIFNILNIGNIDDFSKKIVLTEKDVSKKYKNSWGFRVAKKKRAHRSFTKQ